MKRIVYTCDICGKELRWEVYHFKMHKAHASNDKFYPTCIRYWTYEICPNCWKNMKKYCEEHAHESNV